jgi:hypothetical protein
MAQRRATDGPSLLLMEAGCGSKRSPRHVLLGEDGVTELPNAAGVTASTQGCLVLKGQLGRGEVSSED